MTVARLPQRRLSLEEYLAIEEISTVKHEYFHGEVFAMAGASLAHNEIAANVLTAARSALVSGDCAAYGSDLRIFAPAGLYTYPDVSVICGKVQLTGDRLETATNPAVIVEVLSDATRDYDRIEKFEIYRSIPSLREYVLIEQANALVEVRTRREGEWAARRHDSLDDSATLASIGVELPLRAIYRRVLA